MEKEDYEELVALAKSPIIIDKDNAKNIVNNMISKMEVKSVVQLKTYTQINIGDYKWTWDKNGYIRVHKNSVGRQPMLYAEEMELIAKPLKKEIKRMVKENEIKKPNHYLYTLYSYLETLVKGVWIGDTKRGLTPLVSSNKEDKIKNYIYEMHDIKNELKWVPVKLDFSPSSTNYFAIVNNGTPSAINENFSLAIVKETKEGLITDSLNRLLRITYVIKKTDII